MAFIKKRTAKSGSSFIRDHESLLMSALSSGVVFTKGISKRSEKNYLKLIQKFGLGLRFIFTKKLS